MMQGFHLAPKLNCLISLSSFDVDHQKSAVGKTNSMDNTEEFMAIPALSNPRAGFARCKENNHV
jgi:hypothetical protein